jgi:hypothetical protein
MFIQNFELCIRYEGIDSLDFCEDKNMIPRMRYEPHFVI